MQKEKEEFGKGLFPSFPHPAQGTQQEQKKVQAVAAMLDSENQEAIKEKYFSLYLFFSFFFLFFFFFFFP